MHLAHHDSEMERAPAAAAAASNCVVMLLLVPAHALCAAVLDSIRCGLVIAD